MAVDDRAGSPSGLTQAEAKEFHRLFMLGFIVFTAVALVAHFLAWAWRPWLPGEQGYSALMDGVTVAATTLTSFVA